ncbi:MAG: nucleotide exchange factor GrpE [Candidatus Fischerbacteria bacterium RBG_13_37_8]|uniref:Protein GrpE n=1 Tax=Candidatus Fischerbacteria bacterium RBG_13_37_8 TaxID=1817863 RepID=A0A1F5VUI9_9BACT|nr:MAG: nucleotide exchange factor GrpE [Candidatus Fischerbacteria bacterium RBG_13_37_8]
MEEEKDVKQNNSNNNDNSDSTDDVEIKFDFLDDDIEETSEEQEEETVDKDELLPILLQQEEIENLKKQLEEVMREKDELYDRLLRKLADFNNYRKRIEKEKQEYYNFATANLMRDILPVVDNFEKAIAQFENHDDPSFKGIELICRQLEDILRKHGVHAIESNGKPFDPAFHEAVGTGEVEEIDDNIILEEYQKGYMMHDKLLRPSMVRVNVKKMQKEAVEPDKEVGDNEESHWN